MIDANAFLALLQSHGVGFFAGVPDSLLSPLSAQLLETVPADRHIIAANEGSALALVAGYHLATGAVGCAYMQNSGLTNAISPLTSLLDAEVYSVPALLVIGWRGEMVAGKQLKDEPQHAKMGRITLDLLSCLEIPHAVLHAEAEDVAECVERILACARTQSRPVALVVRQGTFSGDAAAATASPCALTREEALAAVIGALPDDAVVVSTTGKVSRELYELRVARGEQSYGDFLTVGSMGHALQIASGVALARPEKTVVCIDGDGALIMHMGGLATSAALPNLVHIVMNNGAHESVGGQPTNGFLIDMPGLARACGYAAAWRACETGEVARAVAQALSARRSSFVEIRTSATSRHDLSRPKGSPREAKRVFMHRIGVVQE